MDTFTITPLALPGVLLIEPKLFADNRGFFVETYNERVLAQHGIETKFVQDSLSYSTRGVIRGLHRQKSRLAQAKLVRCTFGEVFDVIADSDLQSPTYGQHVSVILKGKEAQMVYIPEGYVHGFCVVSECAFFEYKVSDSYHPEYATGVRYDDPLFSIAWPTAQPILSEQDKAWPSVDSIAPTP